MPAVPNRIAPQGLVRELARLVGPEHALEVPPGSEYNRDLSRRRGVEGRADAVALPGTPEEVREVLAWCYEHDVPLTPRGGGTGLTGGAAPVEGGVVCSLERLRGMRELDPARWRMFPEAGVHTRDVQRLAREHGLFFAPDPGAAEQSQIGGNVATNAGGPHALKYGVTGSWVAGMEVVLAPGELVDIGGWQAKDVAGYDLRSLLVGSEGTLGIITAVRLRLLPAPAVALPVVAFLSDREQGCGAVEQILGSGLRPSVLDFLEGEALSLLAASYPGAPTGPGSGGESVPAGAGFALIAEVDGSREEAEAQREELLGILGGLVVRVDEPADPAALWRWRDGVNGVLTGVRGAKVSEDVVFPRERLAEGLEGFERIAAAHGLRSCSFGHAGDGNVHATVLVDPSRVQELDAADAIGEELFGLVVELGGSIAGEHGVGWSKRGRLESQWPRRAVELHEQIKGVFDPKGLLNPGKKLARYPARSPLHKARKEGR
ncbi:MAG TPA: FAD-linked oxidase C-terminal domain-containing protein [Solirubrobacteraceae bacterium]|nr:FAD-linked oxidase C-terminal domain-containing protein [Solirubrobacteraceae bacterium]